MVETDACTFFRVCNASTATGGHSFKLFVPRKYTLSYRTVSHRTQMSVTNVHWYLIDGV